FTIERRLSKEEIFALYCNEIYLGQRGAFAARGVDQAARVYFGKPLNDLSLAEAAMIAGMIQGPARYSPVHHADAARARPDTMSALRSLRHSISICSISAHNRSSTNWIISTKPTNRAV